MGKKHVTPEKQNKGVGRGEVTQNRVKALKGKL